MGKTLKKTLSSDELCSYVMEWLDEMKVKQMVCLDVREMTNITDFMIMSTGSSKRHVVSLAEHLMLKCKREGILYKEEGLMLGEWVLIDLGDIVIHIFQKEARELYQLEQFWMSMGE